MPPTPIAAMLVTLRGMDPVMARKMWRTLEPYHGMIYFTPRATEAYADIGITGRAGYFASRAAAMGAVSAEVVVATFFNFHPPLVASAIPDAWEKAAPATIVEARFEAADRALVEMLGADVVGSDEMRTAADAARRAAEACTLEGRPLYAGHAGLDWPDPPHLVLWHAVTLLREFRGDGHVAALLVADVDGCEALVTHAAAAAADGGGVTSQVLKASRAWPDDEWQAAEERLRERGWIDGDGRFTAKGEAAREQIEAATDERAMAPWKALGEDACDELRAQIRPWSRTISSSGVFSGR
jgi:hypothetical protein